MNLRPQRECRGNVLYSNETPCIAIRIDDSFRFVGNLSFELPEVHVNQYVFAEFSERKVGRMLVVQFEGYLDGVDKAYSYDDVNSIALGNYEYACDSQYQRLQDMVNANPNSDYGKTDAMLKSQGLNAPELVVRERFLRLLDESMRNEILIIYMEDLSIGGLADENLDGLDENSEKWRQISRELLSRSLSTFQVEDC